MQSNDMGRVQSVTDAISAQTAFTNDLDGNLTEVKDARTNAITFSYNDSGLVNAVTDQLDNSESYAYDLGDILTSFTDRKGQEFSFEYDYLYRIINAASPGIGNHTTYDYDPAGRLTDIKEYENSSLTNSISIAYTNSVSGDRFEDMVKTISTDYGGLTNAVAYDYDELGRRTRMQISGQDIEVFYTYDALNLTNIQVTNTTSGDLDFPFTYDVTGLRNSVAYPNGVLTEYEYFPDGAVYTIAVSNSSGTLETLTYTYDVSGNRKSMTRDGLETKFPSAFTNTPVYNAANRITSFNSATVLYDDNGNMTSWGSTSFTWNANNQLVAINGTSLDASFTYDAGGRRIAKTVNGTTTKYLYDGADIIMEMNGSGVPSAFYVHGPRIDEPLARIDLSTGDIRYYHADALGSIIALTDENGTVKTTYNYTPFGDVEVSGESTDNPFMFTGREFDGDTGLYYYRARYYSPELGRFITEDPIGLSGGINMYAYVGNSPLNFVDPWGLIIVVKGDWRKYHRAYLYLWRDPHMRQIIRKLEKSSTVYTIKMNNTHNDSYVYSTHTINWDPHSALQCTSGGTQSPALGLGHEMDHAAAPWYWRLIGWIPSKNYDDLEERRVILGSETDAAHTLGEDTRTDHSWIAVYHVPTPISR